MPVSSQRFPLLHFRPKQYLPGLSDRVSDNLPWCNLSGRLEHTGMHLQILGCDFNGYAPRIPAEALAQFLCEKSRLLEGGEVVAVL